MKNVWIVSATRTPVGRFMGGLASLSAPRLGGIAIQEALKRAGVEGGQVDEVIMGNVVQAGLGQNPARQAALAAGMPDSTNAFTVNKVCGSGLKAVMLAAQAIRAGDAEAVVAGGTESMSNAPYLLPKGRSGYRYGNGEVLDALVSDGLTCAYNHCHMGNLAEFTAANSKLTRAELDQFAFESQKKAAQAQAEGKFAAEIVPVVLPQKKGEPLKVAADEGVRADTTLESLAKLKPAFDPSGVVTAGNASTLNDGAAALVLMSEDRARAKGLKPLARVTGYASGHVEPKRLFYAPVVAVKSLLEKTGAKIGDYDLIEANEAFASQSLADGRELGWDWARVNVWGGAIAIGHPIGASGARILVTLLHAMADRRAKRGMATLCLGGGGAVALAVEAV
ncbi:MAG TPA: acetyl-CoA C-acetyltransferase [Candidatus Saccharimonadales bacterium]|nr:acetyl-CoA C-acetyltransferase [Candidatus Saccharimonadales bacterium]